jgi:hypothetical protein
MKFFLLAMGLAFALTSQSQVQFSAFAGPQVTTASYNVKGVKQKTSNKYGFQLGMGMKVPFESRLYFSPAIYYSLKGYKVVFTKYAFPPDADAINNNTTFHTIETAFLLQYDFSDKPGHFFIKAGPSLDFHLFGREKFTTTMEEVERNTPFGYDKYGHYSANMLVNIGYELKNGFFVLGQYSHGLANINNADHGPRIRHRVFGISIGKFLCGNKIEMDTRNRE